MALSPRIAIGEGVNSREHQSSASTMRTSDGSTSDEPLQNSMKATAPSALSHSDVPMNHVDASGNTDFQTPSSSLSIHDLYDLRNSSGAIPSDPSTSVDIGEIVNHDGLSLSSPPSGTFKGLGDLPAELLHLITSYLWSEPEEAGNWYDRFEPSSRDELRFGAATLLREARREQVEQDRRAMRRDVLVLASCCKPMRMAVLRRSILRTVTISNPVNDYAEIVSFSEDFRCSISQVLLQVKTQYGPDGTSEATAAIVNLVEMFPRLTSLSVYVYMGHRIRDTEQLFRAPDANPLDDSHDANKLAGYAAEHPSLAQIRVRAVYQRQHLYAITGSQEDFPLHNYQMRCLLQALRFPGIESVSLSVGLWRTMGENGRQDLLSVIDACNSCDTPALREASLLIDVLCFSGNRDACGLLDTMLQGWLPNSNLHRLSLGVQFVQCPAATRSLFSALRIGREGPTEAERYCNAVPPPESRLKELLTMTTVTRPQLLHFRLSVRCVESEGMSPGPPTVKGWQLHRPTIEASAVHLANNQTAEMTIATISFNDADSASFVGFGRHVTASR